MTQPLNTCLSRSKYQHCEGVVQEAWKLCPQNYLVHLVKSGITIFNDENGSVTSGKWTSSASAVKCFTSFDLSVFVMKPSGVPRKWGTTVMLNVISTSVLMGCASSCAITRSMNIGSLYSLSKTYTPGSQQKNLWCNHNLLSVVPWWIYPCGSLQLFQPQYILHNILWNSSPRWQHKQMGLVMHNKGIQVSIECIQCV